jgi:hypothetical protein
MKVDIDVSIFHQEPTLIFGNLHHLALPIHDKMIEEFHRVHEQEFEEDEFIIDSLEGFFKVNRIKKEFRILKRKYYDPEIYLGYPSNDEIDRAICILYKVAIKSGYKVFLESKFLN